MQKVRRTFDSKCARVDSYTSDVFVKRYVVCTTYMLAAAADMPLDMAVELWETHFHDWALWP